MPKEIRLPLIAGLDDALGSTRCGRGKHAVGIEGGGGGGAVQRETVGATKELRDRIAVPSTDSAWIGNTGSPKAVTAATTAASAAAAAASALGQLLGCACMAKSRRRSRVTQKNGDSVDDIDEVNRRCVLSCHGTAAGGGGGGGGGGAAAAHMVA